MNAILFLGTTRASSSELTRAAPRRTCRRSEQWMKPGVQHGETKICVFFFSWKSQRCGFKMIFKHVFRVFLLRTYKNLFNSPFRGYSMVWLAYDWIAMISQHGVLSVESFQNEMENWTCTSWECGYELGHIGSPLI